MSLNDVKNNTSKLCNINRIYIIYINSVYRKIFKFFSNDFKYI